jgi:intein-encoded DNA endonuclease-like protein
MSNYMVRDSKGRFVKGMTPWNKKPIPPKEELEKLYSQGFGVYKIAKIYGVSHFTVWNWLKHYNIKRRNGYKKDVDLSPTPNLAYFLGVVLGDGNCHITRQGRGYVYRIRLKVRSKEFAESFKKVLEKMGLKPHFYSRFVRDHFAEGVFYFVDVACKKLVLWYKSLSISDIAGIVLSSKEHAKEFLRGFYEADGTYNRKQEYVRIYNANRELLELCKKALALLGIRSWLSPKKYNGNAYFLHVSRGKHFLEVVKPCIKNE